MTHERRVVLEDHDRVVGIGDVDLRHAPREIRTRGQLAQDAAGQRRAAFVDQHAVRLGVRGEAVDDRQVELGVIRTEFVDDDAAVDRSGTGCR